MKAKVAIVPKWKPKEPMHIVRMRWLLKRGITDRRERERVEAQIQDFENSFK